MPAIAFEQCDFADVDDARLEAVWEGSLRSTLFVLQAAFPHLRGRGGRRALVTPTVSMSGAARLVPYTAAIEGQRVLAQVGGASVGPRRHPRQLPRARARARADRRGVDGRLARRRPHSAAPAIRRPTSARSPCCSRATPRTSSPAPPLRRRRRLDGAVSSAAGRGRTAIVTGAGQGVGEGIAHAFAAAGANVVIAARRAETGEPVGRGDPRPWWRGRRASSPTCTSAIRLEACVAATVKRYGGLEIMVHNAFRGGTPHRLEDVELELWEQNSRTAVWGSYYSAVVAHPHLAAAGTTGRLILLTSPVGRGGQRQHPALLAGEGRTAGDGEELVAGVGTARDHGELHRARRRDARARRRVRARTRCSRSGSRRGRRSDASATPSATSAASRCSSPATHGGYVTGQTIVCDGGSFMGL